jgi:hypothetical protein
VKTLRLWWAEHGTKILGALTASWASLCGTLAALSASPDVQFLLPHRYFAYLAVGNILLGSLTVRRGFVNSRSCPKERE